MISTGAWSRWRLHHFDAEPLRLLLAGGMVAGEIEPTLVTKNQSPALETKRWYSPLQMLPDFLVVSDTPCPVDLIYVLAGRPERKPYGIQLFQSGLAARLILSVARFEVRQTVAMGLRSDPDLLELALHTPVEHRHFFLDFHGDPGRAVLAGLRAEGTYGELAALATYLCRGAVESLGLVSTSIHLRRVRFCCQKIAFFRTKKLFYLPVPEEQSSFRHERWWKHAGHWSYVTAEYAKLAAYFLRYSS